MTNYIFNNNQGMEYTRDKTRFKVWAPTRDSIDLLLYNDYRYVRREKYRMTRVEGGFFETVVTGDLKGKFYTYLVNGKYEVTDPYSIACSINSKRSAIIDIRETDPSGFREQNVPFNPWKKALLYEVHIKDFSGDISSGTQHRGKFLGLIDEKSHFREAETGIRHLKDLGITHVHLMPIYDFLSVDEHEEYFFDDNNYNWGYDPELYNCIEGSYSTQPLEPANRIYEFKKMIQRLHSEGLSVVMDVVFNHTFRSHDSNFNILNPGYYFRMDQNNAFCNGSGCGNELASERKMVQNFIVDSLKYYMKEYKINGFRFDLMALIDKKTVYRIVKELREINPEVIIYGEPWYACESGLHYGELTVMGTQRGKEFSFFNDRFRDALKGDNDAGGLGYVQGAYHLKTEIETGISGSIDFDEYHSGFALEAKESINYFNSHDNLIIYDKLKMTMDYEWVEPASRMLASIIYMSLGIPFIHSGNEFLRGKNLEYNSYNLALDINGIDWGKKYKNTSHYEYYKELIQFRKDHPVFDVSDPEEIREKLCFYDKLPMELIGYTLKTDNGYLMIFHNAGKIRYQLEYNRIQEHFDFYHLGGISPEEITLSFDERGRVSEELKDIDNFEIGPLTTVVYSINKQY